MGRRRTLAVDVHDGAEAGKAAPKAEAPGIGAHADALRASSKDGGMDHWSNQAAAAHMSGGDTQALKNHLAGSETAERDHILDHIHPDHWEGLGFKPLNKDKSVKAYEAKFGAKPGAAPAARKTKTSDIAAREKLKAGNKKDAVSEKADLAEKMKSGKPLGDDEWTTHGGVKDRLDQMAAKFSGHPDEAKHKAHIQNARYVINGAMKDDKELVSEKHQKQIGHALAGTGSYVDGRFVERKSPDTPMAKALLFTSPAQMGELMGMVTPRTL
jgi:hypothetical protein